MKTWKQLTKQQQETAVKIQSDSMVRGLAEGVLRFRMPQANRAIQKAVNKAEAMHTPWFTSEYIWEEVYHPQTGKTLESLILQIAQEELQGYLFPEPGEEVFSYILD